ncbi:MAG: RNA 2',3'-cyclic phosphodiesterase [Bacteroidetes bacterium]|nr:RNA 2',3'-cyclic phosphodiesterase [Bacteroidota bacterium]
MYHSEDPPHRLFLGVPLSNKITSPMIELGNSLNNLKGIRWIPEQNLHVTVFFFGNVKAEMIENLISLIQVGLKNIRPFQLEFDQYTLAPRPKDPRMIWARYKKEPAFKELVESMQVLYEQIAPRQQNRKSPIPHITLARLKHFDPDTKLDLQRHLPPQILKVGEVVLWKSELRPEGADYRVVERFNL